MTITDKHIAKIIMVINIAAAIAMTFNIFNYIFRGSFSENATAAQSDWLLTLYLGSGIALGVWMAGVTLHRESRMIFLGIIKMRWKLLYLLFATAFLLVRATNVSDYSMTEIDWDHNKILAHFIATILVALFGYGIVTGYTNIKTRKGASFFGLGTTGVVLFICSLISSADKFTTSQGELAVTFAFLIPIFIIANEQIKTKNHGNRLD